MPIEDGGKSILKVRCFVGYSLLWKKKKKKNSVSPNMSVSDGPFPIIKVVQIMLRTRQQAYKDDVQIY